MRKAIIICRIQHFEADFLRKVSLKILNSGIILKTFTHGIMRRSLGPVVNILAIFTNADILKKQKNKKIPHQRYRLPVIDFE